MAIVTQLLALCPLIIVSAVYLTSMACYSLRDFSRSRLEEICRQHKNPDRLSQILQGHYKCLLLCEMLQLVFLLVTTWLVLKTSFLGDFTTLPVGDLQVQATWWFRLFAIAVTAGVIFVALPWSMANVHGESFLYTAWPVLKIICTAGSPLWKSISALDRVMHRVFGVPEPNVETTATLLTEELLTVVDESRREGVIESHASTMIHRVMDLQNEDVAAIMTPRTDMVTIPYNLTIPQAMDEMLENGFSRVPVVRDGIDDIVGILYVRDLLAVINKNRGSSEAETVTVQNIARDVLYAPESQGIGDLLESMQQKKVHMAIIVDEYSGVSGLVTLEDILEEIVGEIADEYDSEETTLWKEHNDGVTEVDARYHLDDLNEELGYEFPEDEEFDTIGGFMMSCFGRIPVVGEQHFWKNLKLTVIDADERRLIRVRIEGEPTHTASQENSV